MDTGSTPKRVGCRHLPDQGSNLGAYRASTAVTPSGNPAPEEAKALAMPRHDRFGSYDDQRSAPILPGLGENQPEEAIGLSQSWSLALTFEHRELLTEGQILRSQFLDVRRTEENERPKAGA